MVVVVIMGISTVYIIMWVVCIIVVVTKSQLHNKNPASMFRSGLELYVDPKL